MKLSKLIFSLFQASEFTFYNSLATHTDNTMHFIRAMIAQEGDQFYKESMAKMDIVFDELTKDVSEEEFLAALELVSTVRRLLIEKEQIL